MAASLVASATPTFVSRTCTIKEGRRVHSRASSVKRVARGVVKCQASGIKTSTCSTVQDTKETRSFHALNTLLTSSAALSLLAAAPALAEETAALAEETGYFQGSYNVTLGLFIFALPGLWSLVKRSTKSKIVRKTYTVPGPAADTPEALDVLARRISEYFKTNNYRVKDAGETITFEGAIAASKGQAAALTFYAFIGLLCTGLVVSIAVPSIGDNAYYAVLLSPGAGYYYTANAERKEECEIKLVTSDDDKETDIIIQADAEEVERFWKTLELKEKDMEFVEGLL